MNENFIKSMEQKLEDTYNTSETENGAFGYKTTGKALLDLNFSLPSLRDDTRTLFEKWDRAYSENPELAIKWLFYCRDIREGLGERSIFRKCLERWALNDPNCNLFKYVPVYGRWDDLVELVNCKNTDISNEIIKIIDNQLRSDKADLELHKDKALISLLAKWLPSINCSNKNRIWKANFIANSLKMTPRKYRQLLSKLRAHLNIVERKMSVNDWLIDYSKVPSKANLKYSQAFLRHDKDRRVEFLSKVMEGTETLNMGVAFPHEIVHQMMSDPKWYENGYHNLEVNNTSMESAWKSLPRKDIRNVLVVADGSGSMEVPISRKTSVQAIEVANSLAIYFAENNTYPFKDKYITFSERPQFVNLTVPEGCKNPLETKLRIASKHSEVANTNIEAVFDLILKTAVSNKTPVKDMPEAVLIISDMEFDRGVSIIGEEREKLFVNIQKRYEREGYKLPRCIFWNVNSRTNTIPIKENELGVTLVSGYSINLVQMVMSGELDPYKALCQVLTGKRYEKITLEKKEV